MERSESNKSVDPEIASGGAYKNMIYVFIARDADMIVYEYHVEKRLNQSKFQADIYEILNTYQDISDIEARP